MDESPKKKILDRLYVASLLIKAFDGLVEIATAIFIYFSSQNFLESVLRLITRRELGEDPQDFFSRYLLDTARSMSVSTQHFLVFYLMIHGIIKFLLVVALLKKKLWAYPVGISFFVLFTIYQLYRYTHTHSIWLIILSAFDLFIAWLVFREYRYAKQSAQ